MKDDLGKIVDDLYEQILSTGRQWKIDGRMCQPTHDDVSRLLVVMLDDVRNLGYDSIESGGIMVRRDGHKLDIFVRLGELDVE